MKQMICTICGLVGSTVATFFGGWTSGMTTLLIFMTVDYVSGLLVAGVFKKSNKTSTGKLESRACWKGLCRKGMSFVFVLVAHHVDLVIGTDYFRDAVVIAFITNELISVVEKAGLMGIKLPSVITKSIEVLQQKADKEGETNGD